MAVRGLRTAQNLGRSICECVRSFSSKAKFIEPGFDFGRPMYGPAYGIMDAPLLADTLPSNVDWSKVPGIVESVFNQKGFGICYLCAGLGCMSCVHALKTYNTTREYVVLSPQHVIDCNTRSIGNPYGGFGTDVLDFAVRNGGILAESEYPFTGKIGTCKNKEGLGVAIDDWLRVKPNCDLSLRYTLAHQPVVADINLMEKILVDGRMIRTSLYKKGVIKGRSYYRNNANHCVVLLGYGDPEPGNTGWRAINSYGRNWGEDGKCWISRRPGQRGGALGVLRNPYTPLKWKDRTGMVTARCQSCPNCFKRRNRRSP